MTGAPHAIVFAGGGTGGHIFPSLAIAERVRALRGDDAPRCVFLVSQRAVDARILTDHAERFEALPARPFGVRPRALASFLWNWGESVRRTRSQLRLLRAEGEVRMVCTGGFVCAPAARAAIAERVPYVLVNLDAVPGRANTLIARHAAASFTIEGGRTPHGWTPIAPIVRAEAMSSLEPADARRALGLDPALPTLLIVGGSQGARTLNGALRALLGAAPELFAGWQALHLSGDGPVEELQQAYRGAGAPARVEPFLREMGLAWRSATLAISRCGAGAVAEAWATQTPCVFLPFPFHRDDHQRANARALERVGGAIVITDHVDAAANAQAIRPTLERLLREPSEPARMRAALAALGPADGADRVARALLGLPDTT